MTNLNETSKQVYEANKLKGFDVQKENLSQTLLLIVSEIVEAQDALRTNSYTQANLSVIGGWVSNEDFIKAYKESVKGTFEEEIADAFIRLMDLVGALEIDIDKHIELKRRFNSLCRTNTARLFKLAPNGATVCETAVFENTQVWAVLHY